MERGDLGENGEVIPGVISSWLGPRNSERFQVLLKDTEKLPIEEHCPVVEAFKQVISNRILFQKWYVSLALTKLTQI